MTPSRLAEIEARAEAATPAPWRTNTKDKTGEDWLIGMIMNLGSGDYADHIVTTDKLRASQCVSGGAEEDAEFIAHARQDIPDLIAEVKRLEEEVDTLMREQRTLEETWGLTHGP